MKDRIINNFVITLLFLICIVFISSINYKNIIMPNVINDEYGYWLTASYVAGRDWSSISKGIQYYGYGYGLILGLVLKLCNNCLMAYKVGLYLNCLWLSISFMSLQWCIKELCRKIGFVEASLCALFCVLTINNVCLTNYTLPEVFLFTLYCCEFTAIVHYFKYKKICTVVVASLIGVIAFAVHQRAIAFLVSLCIVLLWNGVYGKADRYKIIMVILFMFLLVLLSNYVKESIQLSVWSESNDLSGNDFGGQYEKIKYIFTKDGFLSLLNNLSGRIVYSFIASYGLIVVVFLFFIRFLLNKEFYMERNVVYGALLYVSITVVLGIIISAIFLLYPDHTTHVFYGRYTECYSGPLCILGIYIIKEEYTSLNKFIISCIFCMTLSQITKLLISYKKLPLKNYSINAAAISYIYDLDADFYLIIMKIMIIISMIICIIILNNQRILLYVCLCIGVISNVIFGYKAYEAFRIKYYDNLVTSSFKVFSIIEELKVKNELEAVYCTDDDTGVFCAGAPIQFLADFTKIYYFDKNDDMDRLDKNGIIVTSGNIDIIEGWKRQYDAGLYDIWFCY